MPLPLTLKAPTGWKKWIFLDTQIPSTDIFLPDSKFDPFYTPSNGFWIRSFLVHCLIPYAEAQDPFTAFLLGGGTSGTLIGAVAGIANVQVALATNQIDIWGLLGGNPAPQFGFNIGTQFKHQTYLRLLALRIPINNAIVFGNLDVAQNSKYKRIYLHHGEVVRFVANSETSFTLTTDMENENPINPIFLSQVNSALVGIKIRIVKATQDIILDATITSVDENWNFDINIENSLEQPVFPETGDYYSFSKTGVIEDPFLMSGFWAGPENDWPNSSFNHSGHNLFWTSQNKFYEEGEFLGIYTFNNVSSGNVMSFAVGATMENNSDSEWRWIGFQNTSEIYPDDVRYRTNAFSGPSSVAMPIGTINDYDIMLNNLEEFTHLRVEINKGGIRLRENYQAPALEGEYLINNNRLYKILAHIESNIIDVAMVSLHDQIIFNPENNQTYETFIQSAWMLNEHYHGDPGESPVGFLSGTIDSAIFDQFTNKTIVTISGILIDSTMKFYIYNQYDPPDITNTFWERYSQTHNHLATEPLKLYEKFQNWVFVHNKNNYPIDYLTFDLSNINIDDINTLTFTIIGEFNGIGKGFIAFDDSFNTVGSVGPEGALFYEHSAAKGVSQICLDSEETIGPYSLDVPLNARFGYGDGFWFGALNNVGFNVRSSTNLITVPEIVGGLSSFYHTTRETNWLFYRDSISGHIAVRRGSLLFKDSPIKNLITIGKIQSTENISSENGISVINLDLTKERLHRISFQVPEWEETTPTAFTFGIGDSSSLFGFPISGDGNVDLQALRHQNIIDAASSSFTFQGQKVSPVYHYKRIGGLQYLSDSHSEVNIDTKDGPIYIADFNDSSSAVSLKNVSVSYVNNNQLLSNGEVGFFDAIRVSDGEIIFFYGQRTGAFVITGDDTEEETIINGDGTRWQDQDAVFAIATPSDSFKWGTPVGKQFERVSNFQYPLMLLNAVTYLSAVYNDILNLVTIFVKCTTGSGDSYIGCMNIALHDFLHKVYLCSPRNFDGSITDSKLPFLWREPNVDDDQNKWTNEGDLINVSDIVPFISGIPSSVDLFTRIIGPEETNSQIINTSDISILSATISEDGIYIMLYDGVGGIRALYSDNAGRNWYDSNIILVRDGSAGIMMGQNIYYITPSSGIGVKAVSHLEYYQALKIARKKARGLNTTIQEEELQLLFDRSTSFLIGSGQIELQKLSGYIDDRGMTSIFFLDLNGKLKCMESEVSVESNKTDKFKVSTNF